MLILESLANLVFFFPAVVERWQPEALVRARDPPTWTR